MRQRMLRSPVRGFRWLSAFIALLFVVLIVVAPIISGVVGWGPVLLLVAALVAVLGPFVAACGYVAFIATDEKVARIAAFLARH